jgi:malonyl-CoA/methylmalonyl-CoA synthetase
MIGHGVTSSKAVKVASPRSALNRTGQLYYPVILAVVKKVVKEKVAVFRKWRKARKNRDWRGAGVADRAGLENRCLGNQTEGSNPSLSASNPAARRFLPMAPHFVSELFAQFARSTSRAALLYRDRSYTYGEVERLVRNGAALLQKLGMSPGDRVVLWTEAKLPFLLAHLSVLYGGGVSVPLNPRFTPVEMGYFLADSGARLVVVGDEQRRILVGWAESSRPAPKPVSRVGLEDSAHPTKLPVLVPDSAVAAAPEGNPRPTWSAGQDACLIVYSSGTTGWPKGVVHTPANLASSLGALEDCWHVSADDIVVNALPLFHIHGLSFATHLTLLCGGCVLLEDAFHSQRTMEAVGQGTVFMAVPTMYYRFLEQLGFADAARAWKKVRLFTCGSAPIRPEVLPRLQEILGRPVINRYGMTEAHVITSLPLDGPWPQGSVGVPLGGIDMRVVNENGQPVAPGQVGRIQVRGPNLFREYWRQAEATRAAFSSGWFDTGDLGAVDANGFLTLVGRSNDLIITSGYNVYPQVVERVINACPGVRESAVIGLPDDLRGERVVAAVVRAGHELDETRLRAWWSERLVDYQQPRAVIFVDALPRNAMGKVLRGELKDQVQKLL